MTITLATNSDIANKNPFIERRRYRRVQLSLLGRFMLEDKTEYPCHVIEMSPGDAVIIAAVRGRLGESVVCYIEELGRIEGMVMRYREGGFVVTLTASKRKRDKIADQLTWIINKNEFTTLEDRKFSRLAPSQETTELHLPDGRIETCKIRDMSLSGAAIEFEEEIPMGTIVRLGKTRGRVIRKYDGGIAIEFLFMENMNIAQYNTSNKSFVI